MTKTTIELSDATLRKAEFVAAHQGVTLSQLVAELLEDLVALRDTEEIDKPWMVGFGELADLADENRRILDIIDEEFGVVDENDCR